MSDQPRTKKPREWTPEEAMAAMEYVLKQRPDVAAEIDRLEIETGDLREADAADIEMGLFGKLYPGIDLIDRSSLLSSVRTVWRRRLNLED